MKIEELISGRKDSQSVEFAGASLPVSAIRRFLSEGYTDIKPYQSEKTFSMWGKACTGCFTEAEIINRT